MAHAPTLIQVQALNARSRHLRERGLIACLDARNLHNRIAWSARERVGGQRAHVDAGAAGREIRSITRDDLPR
jgi:hypothetical protein